KVAFTLVATGRHAKRARHRRIRDARRAPNPLAYALSVGLSRKPDASEPWAPGRDRPSHCYRHSRAERSHQRAECHYRSGADYVSVVAFLEHALRVGRRA